MDAPERYPANRPGWVGDYQPWPCGRCGKEVEYDEKHPCPEICAKCNVIHEEV